MSHGFDNMADCFRFPCVAEGYIRAARKISREAVGDPSAQALTTTYSVPRVLNQTLHIRRNPLRSYAGGTAASHDFPADGEYVFKLGFYYSPTVFGLN